MFLPRLRGGAVPAALMLRRIWPGHARPRLESYRGGGSLSLHRPPEPVQVGEFRAGQHDPRRGDVLFQMRLERSLGRRDRGAGVTG